MYNARMWLVVKPSVGVPMFFAGVALTSLAVHTAVLTNTTWFPEFLNGKGRATVAAAPAATPVAAGGGAQSAIAAAQSALASGQVGVSSISVNLVPK